MKNLQVRIIFRSGRKTELTSYDYYQGQFKEWCLRNFVKNEYQKYDFILWNDFYININEIEKMEEIKE